MKKPCYVILKVNGNLPNQQCQNTHSSLFSSKKSPAKINGREYLVSSQIDFNILCVYVRDGLIMLYIFNHTWYIQVQQRAQTLHRQLTFEETYT